MFTIICSGGLEYRNGLLCTPTQTTHIYTLPLLDALPISLRLGEPQPLVRLPPSPAFPSGHATTSFACPDGNAGEDRKSTRLNSSQVSISYDVFCLKIKIQ